MKTYQNEHLRIQVDCGIHLLQQTWVGVPNQANFRDGALATLALAKRHQVSRWVIDLRDLRLFNPIDLHWFIRQWLPQAHPGLPRRARVAIILTDLNQFSKVGADLILKASMSVNSSLSCRYFVDEETSRQWLLTPT